MPRSLDVTERMMSEALRLARRGEGQVSPNPLVGAVIVNNGEIVGRGYHRRAGEPHAEIMALRRAGPKARGATMYLNLEPCCHQGRTPPCADAIIQSGISRVVASVQDPNPLVNGAGFKRLRSAGVAVAKGSLEEKAKELNEVFFTYITRGRPFMIAKVAMSLDGKMATATGESKWITTQMSRHFSYKLRRTVDAIMVGVNTVLADDPELLRRPNRPALNRPFTRVVVDTNLRTPPWAKIMRSARTNPVLFLCGSQPSTRRRQALEKRGATVVPVTERDGRVDLVEGVRELARREITSVVLEGGAEVLGSAFDNRLVDKVVFFIAPKIIGGVRAISPVGGKGARMMSEAIPVVGTRWIRVGQDVIVSGRPDYRPR